MSTQHYLKKLSPFKNAKINKIKYYFSFLETLNESENNIISDDFYHKNPLYQNPKLLKEVLHSFTQRGIAPDTNFVDALDEYFRFRVENC